jgi:hypothetical protein
MYIRVHRKIQWINIRKQVINGRNDDISNIRIQNGYPGEEHFLYIFLVHLTMLPTTQDYTV